MRRGLVLLAVLLPASTAHAGRNFFGWLQDTDVMPERGVEMQSWIEETSHNKTENNLSVSRWGVSPYIGITDQLELELPVEVIWFGKTGGPAGTSFSNYGAELRYRLVSNDPEDKPPFAPLVRIEATRLTFNRDAVVTEVGFTGSYDAGIVHAVADVSFESVWDNESEHELQPGAGVSIEVVDELRLGAEVFSHIALNEPDTTTMTNTPRNWVIAGPNASWTHGRFWISGAFGIGIKNIGNAPRVTWGIAF